MVSPVITRIPPHFQQIRISIILCVLSHYSVYYTPSELVAQGKPRVGQMSCLKRYRCSAQKVTDAA